MKQNGILKNLLNYRDKFVLLLLSMMISGSVFSNWIIFSQRYTADPAVIVHEGRVYVYLSHDTDEQRNFSMDGYTCISSDDLLNWTDHGEVLMASDIPYISVEGKKVFWAPEAIKRNDKFYLYYCTPDYGNDPTTTGTGVCVSKHPTGPFTDPRGSLMITGHRVDVGILIENDQAYGYWPNGLIRNLADNMYEFAEEKSIAANGKEKKIIETEKKDNSWNGDAHEAPYVKKINDRYYYMYMTFNDQELWACSQHNAPPDGCGEHAYDGDYFHRYHFLETPTGGIKEPESVHGRTMMWPVVGDNTQPAVFEFAGNYYSLYHSKILAKKRNEGYGYQRNVGLDRLYFNPDGTIIPQAITKEGLKQAKYLNPYIRQQAETIGRENRIETLPTKDKEGGRDVTDIDPLDWIKVFGVDFGTGASSFDARVASPVQGGIIQVRLDSVNGETVARLDIPNTGGLDQYKTLSAKVKEVKGVHDLFFVFPQGGFHFNWWQFKGGEPSGTEPPRVIKRVSIRSHANDLFVSAGDNELQAESGQIGDEESYKLIDNEDGTYSFYSESIGQYLSCQSGEVVYNDTIEGEEERFLLMHSPDGSYCLFSRSDQSYLYSPEDGSLPLAAGIAKPWEEPWRDVSRFWIEYMDEPSITPNPAY